MILPATAFPDTAALLIEGGDSRIALDAHGLNKYGCPAAPDATLLAFGSCTASTISPGAYQAAEQLRQQALESGLNATEFYQHGLPQMREQLRHGLGLADDTAVVFAASGTDLHLLAGQLAGPCLAVLIAASETGANVPTALSGCHFSSRTAMGATAQIGTLITGAAANTVLTVALRDEHGNARDAAAIDADIEARVSSAMAQRQPVLLVLVDVSKTGMTAPSLDCALRLQRQYPQLDILVDACQLRLAPTRVCDYLEHGFMVAVTGSKFLGGPTFSAALLLPAASAQRLGQKILPAGLADYGCRADWPEIWPGASALPEGSNLGLLLRWHAALYELQAFRALPESSVLAVVHDFAQAMEQRLANDPALRPVPVSTPERRPAASHWDQWPTIFPFLLQNQGQALNRAQTSHIYLQLQRELAGAPGNLRCQLGQPVACGDTLNALRLCLSARQIVSAAATGISPLIQSAMQALDKTVWLIKQQD